jgi:hypothetical protein
MTRPLSKSCRINALAPVDGGWGIGRGSAWRFETANSSRMAGNKRMSLYGMIFLFRLR